MIANAHLSDSFLRYIIIVCCLFLIEIPVWVIIFADDAGQINSIRFDVLIETAEVLLRILGFPLIHFLEPGNVAAFILIFQVNLLILAFPVLLMINGVKAIRKRQIG